MGDEGRGFISGRDSECFGDHPSGGVVLPAMTAELFFLCSAVVFAVVGVLFVWWLFSDDRFK